MTDESLQGATICILTIVEDRQKLPTRGTVENEMVSHEKGRELLTRRWLAVN